MEYDVTDAEYAEGKLAFELGKLPADCPYPKWDNSWHMWMAGHSAAEFNLTR